MQKLSKIFKKTLFIEVLVLFVLIPLYPKIPLFGVSGTFVAIRVEDFFIALTFVTWGFYLIISRQLKAFFQNRINQSILLFFFISILSIFSAIFLTNTVMPHLAILHFFRRVELILLLPIVLSAVQTKKQVIFILWMLSIVVLVVNIYALGQQYLDWPVISTTNSEFSKGQILRLTPEARVNSTFAGHYDLAIFMVMVITVASALFFGFRNIFIKLWIAFLAGFSFIILIMTAARLSFAAVLGGVVLSFILTGKKIFILFLVLLAVAAVIYPSQLRDRLVSTIVVNFAEQGNRFESTDQKKEAFNKLNIPTLPVQKPSFLPQDSSSEAQIASDIAPGEPTDSTQLGVYRSLEIRTNLEWPRAWRSFLKNPLLGTGYSSLGLATDNDILRSLGEIGILGTLSFALIIIVVTKKVWSLYKSSDRLSKYLGAGVISMIFAFVLNSLFIDAFEASKIAILFWMILGLTLTLNPNDKNN